MSAPPIDVPAGSASPSPNPNHTHSMQQWIDSIAKEIHIHDCDSYWLSRSTSNNNELLVTLLNYIKHTAITQQTTYELQFYSLLAYLMNIVPSECGLLCNQYGVLEQPIALDAADNHILERLQIGITILTVVPTTAVQIQQPNNLVQNVMYFLISNNQAIVNTAVELTLLLLSVLPTHFNTVLTHPNSIVLFSSFDTQLQSNDSTLLHTTLQMIQYIILHQIEGITVKSNGIALTSLPIVLKEAQIDQYIQICLQRLNESLEDSLTEELLCTIEALLQYPNSNQSKYTTLPSILSTLSSSTQSATIRAFCHTIPALLTPSTLQLPFTIADLDRLFYLEVLVNKQSMNEQLSRDEVSIIDELTIDVSGWEQKIVRLARAIGTHGSEEDWRAAVQANELALFHTMVLIFSYIPLQQTLKHQLIQCMWIVGMIAPHDFTTVCLQHTVTIEQIVRLICPHSPDEQLLAQLRLVDLVLVHAHPHAHAHAHAASSVPVSQFPNLLCSSVLEDVMMKLVECLSHCQANIFALATTNLLLLNSIAPYKQHLLRAIQTYTGTDIATGTGTGTGTSSAASTSTSTSASAVDVVSSFSQEVVQLLNQGRYPANWDECESIEIEIESEAWQQYHAARQAVHDNYARAPKNQNSNSNSNSNCRTFLTTPHRLQCMPVTIATLQFVEQCFQSGQSEVFYTNDILVLIDVLIRQLDEQQNNEVLCMESLLCLGAVLEWPEYGSRQYKVEEVHQLLGNLLHTFGPTERSEQEHLSEEVDEIHAAIEQLAQQLQSKLRGLTQTPTPQ